MGLFHAIETTWAQYRAFRAALAELDGYSDRELAGLGLARGDVARVAYEEAERRVGARSARPETPRAAGLTPARA